MKRSLKKIQSPSHNWGIKKEEVKSNQENISSLSRTNKNIFTLKEACVSRGSKNQEQLINLFINIHQFICIKLLECDRSSLHEENF